MNEVRVVLTAVGVVFFVLVGFAFAFGGNDEGEATSDPSVSVDAEEECFNDFQLVIATAYEESDGTVDDILQHVIDSYEEDDPRMFVLFEEMDEYFLEAQVAGDSAVLADAMLEELEIWCAAHGEEHY